MFAEFYTRGTWSPDDFLGLQVYARCRVAHGTRVFYGRLLKHRILHLWKLVDGDKTAGWFSRDDILEISDKPNI